MIASIPPAEAPMAAIKRSFLGSLLSERVFSFGVLAGLLGPDDFDLIGSLREVQRAWVSSPSAESLFLSVPYAGMTPLPVISSCR